MAATVTFQGSFGNASDLTTYTFPSCDFGPAAADRYICVFAFNRSGSSRTFVSATIGGIAASVVVANVNNGTNNAVLIIAKVPTGTTGQTIAVTWSGACVRCGIALWRLNGITATAFDTTSSVASPPSTATLDGEVDGVLVVGAFTTNNTTCSPTGYTEDFDAVISDSTDATYSGGSASVPAGFTNRTITTTFGSHSNPIMVAASFSPAKVIVAAAGSYTWSGVAATLKIARKLTASPGAYAWSGQTVGLFHGFKISAAPGAYLWNGDPATLTRLAKLSATAGSYIWTGTDVTLTFSHNLAAGPGEYLWTGADIDIIYVPPLGPITDLYTRTPASKVKFWRQVHASSFMRRP